MMTMTINQLRVRSVTDHILHLLTKVEVRSYLDEVGAATPDVRRKVQSLLAAHAHAGRFLETPPLVVETAVEPLRALVPGPPSLDFLSPSNRPDSLGKLSRYEILEL